MHIYNDDMDKNHNRVYYQALQYPDEASSQKIKTVAHLGHYQKFIKDDVSAIHIHSFIENLSVRESDENNKPITWLELFILYRLRGYKKPIDDPKDISHVRATMDKQMNTFKTKVRAIVSRIYVNSEHSKRRSLVLSPDRDLPPAIATSLTRTPPPRDHHAVRHHCCHCHGFCRWSRRAGSILMQDSHSGGTVCSPTRASVLTGRNPFRDCVNGVYGCSDMTECVLLPSASPRTAALCTYRCPLRLP